MVLRYTQEFKIKVSSNIIIHLLYSSKDILVLSVSSFPFLPFLWITRLSKSGVKCTKYITNTEAICWSLLNFAEEETCLLKTLIFGKF